MSKTTKLLSVLSICALCASSVDAKMAGNGWYGGTKIGGSLINVDTDLFMDEFLGVVGGSVKSHGEKQLAKSLKPSISAGLLAGYDFYNVFHVPFRVQADFVYNTKIKFNTVDTWVDLFDADENIVSSQSWDVYQELKVGSLLASVFYDFQNSSRWTPYVGANIGAAFIDSKSRFNEAAVFGNVLNNDTDKTNFAIGGTIGVGYKLTDRFMIDANYQYLNYGKIKSAVVEDFGAGDPIYIHVIQAMI